MEAGRAAGPRVSVLTLPSWLPHRLPSVEPSTHGCLPGGSTENSRSRGAQRVAPPPTMAFSCPRTGQESEILSSKTLKSFFFFF